MPSPALAQLAWRNLTRHRVRNLLLAGSVAFCAGLLALVLCVGAGIRRQLVGHVVEAEGGAVSVALKPAFQGPGARGDARLADLDRFLATRAEVRGVRRRAVLRAVLYAGGRSSDLSLVGIEPAREPALVGSLAVSTGALEATPNGIGVAIAEAVAAKLGVHVGDECTLMAQTRAGSVNVVDCRVAALFRGASRADAGAVYAPLALAQHLYDAPLPTELLVDLHDLAQARPVAAAVRARLATTSDTAVVETYLTRVGMASSIANVNRYSSTALVCCLLLIASVGIATAVMSNVAERTPELGTLAALGFERADIVRLIAAETAFLSVAAAAVGVALGIAAAAALAASGLDVGAAASLAFGTRVLRPELSAGSALAAFALGALLPVASAFFPALRGTRLRPVEALRAATV